MTVCGHCGRESPADFGFCPACGAVLAAAPAAREVRKVVTVLFCDLTGSTALGDRTDPEALRSLMRRYYETARQVLERHGGTVEKFIGDAVMAVFGIPVATENDALRAVRAAVELRDTVHALGLEARIGVNTGEVVAGEGDTLVTGDAVNVAQRFEAAAGPGDVLLGDATVRLVRDAVETEPVELTLKGKPEPVFAHRLLSLDIAAAGVARRLDRPMIGRERERDRLTADFEDAVASRTCRLFTIIGPAGVGKSRLVADFLGHVGDHATVARARALSYGEGITYWPLVEMLIQLGVDPDDAIRSSPADTQLTTRAIFERIAEQRPLVLVLDDIQWAEPPMLDLVDHLADWSREAPIFILCIGRPELLDIRPGWGGGKLNATSILLEPLNEADATRLADELLAGTSLDSELRTRILATAEGNPLFLEEMAALAREAQGSVAVPPTIQAVLQARLDTLNDEERTVIERGAVEGKVFHRGAVTALSPTAAREGVAGQLLALVRKELVRPDRGLIAGDDAFRFRHLLIRDTAYASLPKAVRGELHERFADWLATHGSLLEQDEIVGYHLEQAAQYRLELDAADPHAGELAERAAERLGAAGLAAFERADNHATRSLLQRAIGLLPEGPARRRLLPALIDTLDDAGEGVAAWSFVEELERGEESDQAIALALRLKLDPLLSGEPIPTLDRRLDRAQQTLVAAGDGHGVALCERARGYLAWTACQGGAAMAAFRRAYDGFTSAGTTAYQAELINWTVASATFAGIPIRDVMALLDELTADIGEAAGPLLAASLEAARARNAYFGGSIELDDLVAILDRRTELLVQTGTARGIAGDYGLLSVAAAFAGDAVAAERFAREQVASLEAIGDRRVLANALAGWGLRQARLGSGEAALRAVERGRELVRAEDLADQITLDLAEGLARAVLGEAVAARALVDRARAMGDGIDMAPVATEMDHTDALVRRLAGDEAGARAIAQRLVETADWRGTKRIADWARRDVLPPA